MPRIAGSVFILFWMGLSGAVFAQADVPVGQAQSHATLALAGLDADVDRAMHELHVPGVAVGVIVGDKVVLAKGYGVRALGKSGEVDAETIFAVGSISKSFTTTVMATLVDEGKLDWDRPVRDYLPWFSLYDPAATQLTTPRDLATHRTGMARHDFLRFSTYLTREELVRRLRYIEPDQSFRDRFEYNNLTYTAAGFLAGEVAHSDWETLVRQRIFVPLGMTRSNTSVHDTQNGTNYAKPHVEEGDKIKVGEFYDYQRFGVGPNGAVNSSVSDLLRYAQMQLDDGIFAGQRVVSSAQIRELHRPVVIVGDGPSGSRDYALGWFVTEHRHHRFVEHAGSINGFTAQLILDPQTHAGIVVLNNLGTPLPQIIGWDIADRLLDLPHEDYLAFYRDERAKQRAAFETSRRERAASRVRGTRPTLALSAYAGRYFHPAYGAITVRADGKDLVVQFDALQVRLTHFHYDTFDCDSSRMGGQAQFRLNRAGQVAELLLPVESDDRPLAFVRQRGP